MGTTIGCGCTGGGISRLAPHFGHRSLCPAAWSETRVLDGEVGEFIVLARKHRSKPEWFLGAITNWTTRTVRIPLGFLTSGEYTAEIYADGPAADTDARDASFETRSVLAADTLTVRMAPGGGQAIRFFPNTR